MTNHVIPSTEGPPETPLFAVPLALPEPGEQDTDAGQDQSWHRQAWGSRESLREMTMRVKRFMPGGDKLTWDEALVLVQYGMLTGANVLRGEIYAYTHKGQVILVEGYKLLVRWAKSKSDYLEHFEPLEVPDGWLGQRCYILPLNQRSEFFAELLKAGVEYMEAFHLVATYGDGVVKASEMGSQRPPPAGWTWDQRCRTRALKQALRYAYGAPSMDEIARETWMVGDTHTTALNWDTALAIPGLHPREQERLAALDHDTDQWRDEFDQLSPADQAAVLDHNRTLLRGEPGDGKI